LLISSNDLSAALVILTVSPLSNGISTLIQVLSVQKKTFNYSNIWPRLPLYRFGVNGKEVVLIYLAQVTPGLTDTYQSHRIAKIVVCDNNIGQVITQDSFLAIIVYD